MSNYFQTLKRLEREQASKRATPQQPLTTIEPVEQPQPEVEPPAPAPQVVKPKRVARIRDQRQSSQQIPQVADAEGHTVGSFASLFDNLRAIGNGGPVSTLVVAGVSTVETVERVTNGLASEVCSHSLRVMVAELFRNASQPLLRVRMATRDQVVDGDSSTAAVGAAQQKVIEDLAARELQLDLRGGPVPEELTGWLDTARSANDIVIIEAPPLGVSVDAAMVARACDGIILVVEPRGTSRDALTAAVERAETVGCKVLGVVMQGRPEWMPSWLRRLTAMRNLF